MYTLYDIAHDAIANAIDAGYQFTICPNCGESGWWARDDRRIACPMCDKPIIFRIVERWDGMGRLLHVEYHVIGATAAERRESRQAAERRATSDARMNNYPLGTTGYGCMVTCTPLPECTC